jgi:hypothetical protein
MVCRLVEEGWMIGLIWLHPRHDQKWLLITMNKLFILKLMKKLDDQVESMDLTMIQN